MLENIETPRLVLDKARLERNTTRFLRRAAEHNILLCPHLKTSKSIDVARLATGGRMSCITVSTLKEAGYFAASGFDDIMYAVGVTPNKFAHVKRIAETSGCNIRLITDNLSVARAAVDYAESQNCTLQFLIEVDCGEHRGGLPVDSPDLVEIARLFQASDAIRFRGVMTHAGHSYATDSLDQVREIAETERKTAVDAAARLSDFGIDCEIISVGSTPTFLFAENFKGLTEVRCGVYMFFDLAQYSRGVCTLDDIAVSVLATVIGHNRQGQSLVLDAGAFALSRDASANRYLPDCGYGFVCDTQTMERLGALSVQAVHQEHGTVPVEDANWFEKLPVGSQIRILPNHACATAAAYDNYLVIEAGAEQVSWPRVNGW